LERLGSMGDWPCLAVTMSNVESYVPADFMAEIRAPSLPSVKSIADVRFAVKVGLAEVDPFSYPDTF
jgi:hypothetical protein